MIIRIFKDTAELYLLCLAFIKYQGYDVGDILYFFKDSKHIGNWHGSTRDTLTSAWRNLSSGGSIIGTHMVDHVDKLSEQIVKVNANLANKDGMIIDKVVELTAMSFGRNCIPSGTLTSLRKAVLLPNEIAEVDQKLLLHETYCTECGTLLHSGELVTLHVSDNKSRERTLRCVNCMPPTLIACRKCNEAYNIPKKVAAILSKHLCPDCTAPEAGKAKASIAAVGIAPAVVVATDVPASPSRIGWAEARLAAGDPTLQVDWSSRRRRLIPPWENAAAGIAPDEQPRRYEAERRLENLRGPDNDTPF